MAIITRKALRLKQFDYSQAGAYFVTICTKNNVHSFGNISNNQMILNPAGQIVQECWNDLSNHYENCQLDEYIIMPNHFHGIINITHIGRHGLPEFIRGFKTFSSRKINEYNVRNGLKPFHTNFSWHKSFYDHIIRNDADLNRIREYIINNPLNWETDENNN